MDESWAGTPPLRVTTILPSHWYPATAPGCLHFCRYSVFTLASAVSHLVWPPRCLSVCGLPYPACAPAVYLYCACGPCRLCDPAPRVSVRGAASDLHGGRTRGAAEPGGPPTAGQPGSAAQDVPRLEPVQVPAAPAAAADTAQLMTGLRSETGRRVVLCVGCGVYNTRTLFLSAFAQTNPIYLRAGL